MRALNCELSLIFGRDSGADEILDASAREIPRRRNAKGVPKNYFFNTCFSCDFRVRTCVYFARVAISQSKNKRLLAVYESVCELESKREGGIRALLERTRVTCSNYLGAREPPTSPMRAGEFELSSTHVNYFMFFKIFF